MATALGALLGALCAATALGKLLRSAVETRAERAVTRMRPRLVQLVAGNEGEVLLHGRGADGRAVDRLATELLGKVRGEAHADLVAMLEDRGVLARARRRLRRGHGAGRARAAELLGAAHDRRSVPELLGLLRGRRRREIRSVAARALGRIGDPVAVPALLDALGHGVTPRTVAQAVLQIGLPAEERLRRELLSGGAPARALAARVLGLAGAVTAGQALARAIATDPDAEVRVSAAASAGRLGAPCAVDALLDALAPQRTRAERAAAAEALGRMSVTGAAEPLTRLVGEPDVAVAHAAACALARLGPDGRARLEALDDAGGLPAEHAREALRRAA
ncbi:MAG TPA: HEAT repeat domain-containing protein [Acidimicrobiia bacterium]|nr:HEAT repeat domain-containing protein [Acidimicrobiia bacterium]